MTCRHVLKKYGRSVTLALIVVNGLAAGRLTIDELREGSRQLTTDLTAVLNRFEPLKAKLPLGHYGLVLSSGREWRRAVVDLQFAQYALVPRLLELGAERDVLIAFRATGSIPPDYLLVERINPDVSLLRRRPR